ncbi:Hypothetical protein Nlim_0724 [Candidatus Nitrosarchaeum limnium SFB1]|jgi:hypothetical protein|uniref:Uncharacterized protein n=1 Tax=Candidatus Nitrosarchaeum limnium SFB1 TaxID=886738 RepID=F3KJR6_9ARCH|nr:Hypothetical protein Nlim_0724 [Candidatus Nitrosarchaeum limnium SFB1]
MKISEIKVDDSQTVYYWLQIFVKNQKEAFALRDQIFHDQEIKERIHSTIKQSQQIAVNSPIEMEVINHNIIIEKLQSILDGKEM